MTVDLTKDPDLIKLFNEAKRRFEIFGRPNGKSLGEMWIGLGTLEQYNIATATGLMVQIGGPGENRPLSWYKLTKTGIEHYNQLFGENHE